MPDTYVLRLKEGQTYLSLLNEWQGRFGARLDWQCEKKADDGYQYHAIPIRKYKSLGGSEILWYICITQ